MFLAIYIIGQVPSVLIHHHNFNVPSFSKASICKKTIYYSNSGIDCKHKTHISTTIKKCALCDNHTVTPHAVLPTCFNILDNDYGKCYGIAANSSYFLQEHFILSNKGPPVLSSNSI